MIRSGEGEVVVVDSGMLFTTGAFEKYLALDEVKVLVEVVYNRRLMMFILPEMVVCDCAGQLIVCGRRGFVEAISFLRNWDIQVLGRELYVKYGGALEYGTSLLCGGRGVLQSTQLVGNVPGEYDDEVLVQVTGEAGRLAGLRRGGDPRSSAIA